MKVLYIVTAYPRFSGDVITPWLIQTIQRLRARGVEVEVLAPSYRGARDQVVDGVRVHRFRYAPRAWETLTHDQTAPDRIRQRPVFAGLLPGYVLAGSWSAVRLARTGNFSAVHAFWPMPHGLLGVAAKLATGLPLVSTFFGVELTWLESQLRWLKPLVRSIVRRSDAVTAISSHTATLLRRLDPAARPVVIPFGAAITTAREPSSERRDRAAGKPLKLLFVGRLVERKGVHVLLDALAKLARTTASLDVVGDGPEFDALVDQAHRLELLDRVTFHGFVDADVLQSQLADTDVLVLPAVTDTKGDVEGLGVVLLEAMSFGKPVIASESGGIVDIVNPGVNGLLVPPGDPVALARRIEFLANEPALLETLGANARQDVEARFSWEVILDRLVEVYEGVVSENRPERHRGGRSAA